MMYALVSLGITCLMLLLSIAFRAAGKLRLTIPLLYFPRDLYGPEPLGLRP